MSEIAIGEFGRILASSRVESVQKVSGSGWNDNRTFGLIIKMESGETLNVCGTDGTDIDGASALGLYLEEAANANNR